MTAQLSVLQTAWSALGQDPAALEGVRPGGAPGLPSRLGVDQLVRDSVASASLAAALLTEPAPQVSLDSARTRTAVTSDRHIRIDGKRPDVWAELSGFWPAGDGWVRTHANYPHHRTRLLHALDLNESATKKEFSTRLRGLEPPRSNSAPLTTVPSPCRSAPPANGKRTHSHKPCRQTP